MSHSIRNQSGVKRFHETLHIGQNDVSKGEAELQTLNPQNLFNYYMRTILGCKIIIWLCYDYLERKNIRLILDRYFIMNKYACERYNLSRNTKRNDFKNK